MKVKRLLSTQTLTISASPVRIRRVPVAVATQTLTIVDAITKLSFRRLTTAALTITATVPMKVKRLLSTQTFSVADAVAAKEVISKTVSETVQVADGTITIWLRRLRAVSESVIVDAVADSISHLNTSVTESFTILTDSVRRVCKTILETFL